VATYLFHASEDIKNRIERAEHILLLLDYDGTLVPIAETPELALLPQHTKHALQMLRHHPKISLGIISGRALSEIREIVGLEGIYYAGNHGLEMILEGTHFIHPEVGHFIPLLRKISDELIRCLNFTSNPYLADRWALEHGCYPKRYVLNYFRGAFLEDKGLNLSLH